MSAICRSPTSVWSWLVQDSVGPDVDKRNQFATHRAQDKDAKSSHVRKPTPPWTNALPSGLRNAFFLMHYIKPRYLGSVPPCPPHRPPNNPHRQGPQGSSISLRKLLLSGGRSPRDMDGLEITTTLGYACRLSHFSAGITSPHRSMVWTPKSHSWSRLLVVCSMLWLCSPV